MAGDWIKMRTDLYRDPKVGMIARILMAEDSELAQFVSQNMQRNMTVTRNVTRNAVSGALLSVWGVARHQGRRDGDDLMLDTTCLELIDDIADIPGFGEAMVCVGWIEAGEETLCFPRFFEEHNTDPATAKNEKNAERQRKYRERKKAKSNALRDVTVTRNALQKSNTEKSRVEKSITLTNTREMSVHWRESEEFQNVWLAWLSHVAFTKAPVSAAGEQQQLYELARFSTEEAIEVVRYSTGRAVNLITNGDHKQQSSSGSGAQGGRRKSVSFEEGLI